MNVSLKTSPAPFRPARHDRHWTKAEDGRLRMLWGEVGVTAVAKALGRAHVSVYWRANLLGLKRGLQPGMECVRAAAERTGFDPITLIKILRWAHVDVSRTMSRPIAKAAYRFRQVDPVDVDEAVEKWLACETIEEAARRHGTDGGTIVRWLEESGEALPPRPGRKCRWRVPSEVIDRVVAKRRSLETIHQASRRVGVGRVMLSKMLKAAGVPRGDSHYWRVNPADVDRAVATLTPRQWSYIKRHRRYADAA